MVAGGPSVLDGILSAVGMILSLGVVAYLAEDRPGVIAAFANDPHQSPEPT